MPQLFEFGRALFPTLITTIVVVLVLAGMRFYLERRLGRDRGSRFQAHLIMLVLTFVGIIVLLFAFPLNHDLRLQILSLLGLLGSGALALSSTTVISNAMAGILSRFLKNFSVGDFVELEDYRGRVSEQGLFHTEIQTEDRDLITIPNAYLISRPLRVVQSTGTMVSARVSLGYDVPRQRVEASLISAAEQAGLSDGFVQILELGDFSVTYRIAGLLSESKRLLSARSQLRECTLDALHGAGIEIVSPNFMNTRALADSQRVIPLAPSKESGPKESADSPDEVIFDKAEQAETHLDLERQLDQLHEEIKKLESTAKPGDSSSDQRLKKMRSEAEALERSIQQLQAKIEDEKAPGPGR